MVHQKSPGTLNTNDNSPVHPQHCIHPVCAHSARPQRRVPPGSARGAAALAGLRGAALYYNDCEFLAEEVARALALGRGGRGALHVAVRLPRGGTLRINALVQFHLIRWQKCLRSA